MERKNTIADYALDCQRRERWAGVFAGALLAALLGGAATIVWVVWEIVFG